MIKYRLKNRISIGNRKNCDFYVKYIRPIYVYPNGIYNPYDQNVLVNGINIKQYHYCSLGDLIEVNDLQLRFKETYLECNYESMHLFQLDQHNPQFFLKSEVFDEIEPNLSIQIEPFNCQEDKTSFLNQITVIASSMILSILMSIGNQNKQYLLILIFANFLVILIQFLLYYFQKRKRKRNNAVKERCYEEYLMGINSKIIKLFREYESFKSHFNLEIINNFASRKSKSKYFYAVDLGFKKQDILNLGYQKQSWDKSKHDLLIEKMIDYYTSKEVLNVLFLNKKILIKNNKKLLDTILAKLIFFHSHHDFKIKLVGEFNYSGYHFEYTQIEDIEENNDLYVFDKHYSEIEHLNINSIVLSQYKYDFYDEIIEELDNTLYFEKAKQTVELEYVDFHTIDHIVKQHSVIELENQNEAVSLFDVHQKVNWNQMSTKSHIIAYLNKNVTIDFHEHYDGSHALIAGSTGSGKSELLQAIIVSLCINYSDKQVQFVVIDYKGSAFASKVVGFPHVIGVMDNLNTDLNRCIQILKKELINRQNLFIQLHITHIDESDLAHLFIVCDEFAQLKKEHPEFIDELVSISRIGRSLGIHLILATQKPSGVVSDEILNNANIKIALKLIEKQESLQIVQSDCASQFRKSGEFVLKTSHRFEVGRAMYVNKLASISNPNRMIVNEKVINDHIYFDYTEREYFIYKMHQNNQNIFKPLPNIQSDHLLLVDELNHFKEVSFESGNYVIYGEKESGKSTALESLIYSIEESVIYYVYENRALSLSKVVNVAIFDEASLRRLLYRLNQKQAQRIYVVIDHFELFMNYDFYEKFEALIKNSGKNNIYFIVSASKQINYFISYVFTNKWILYFEIDRRKEFLRNNFENKKIPGRVWIKDKEAQIGINLKPIDYAIDEKYQLEFKMRVLVKHEIGLNAMSGEGLFINDLVVVIFYDKQKCDAYLEKIKANIEVKYIKDLSVFEMQQYIHKVFVDETALSLYGDYTTTLFHNEVLYVGLRSKEKLKF